MQPLKKYISHSVTFPFSAASIFNLLECEKKGIYNFASTTLNYASKLQSAVIHFRQYVKRTPTLQLNPIFISAHLIASKAKFIPFAGTDPDFAESSLRKLVAILPNEERAEILTRTQFLAADFLVNVEYEAAS